MGSTSSASAPEPPWWDAPAQGRQRAGLTRDAVVTAAIEVLDREGLAGVGMRPVAEALGTGAASLYWHVADKEQLIGLMLDRIIGDIELPGPDPDHWEDQIKAFARNGRDVMRRHRDVGQATLGRVPMGPSLVRAVEWMLGVLRAAGIPDRPASWFGDILALVGAAQSVEDDTAATGDPEAASAIASYFAALPPEEFPNITAVGAELATGTADDRFEFALDLLVRGIASFKE